MNAGIREVKNRLSHYLRKVKQGETVVITERNVPVAKIVPIEGLMPVLKEILSLQEAGLVTWMGGKPGGISKPIAIKGSVLVSDMIAEDRR